MMWTDTQTATSTDLWAADSFGSSALGGGAVTTSALLGTRQGTGQTLGQSAAQTLAIVDPAIAQLDTILAGLTADRIIVLDPTQDSLSQITTALGEAGSVQSIQIFSHGSSAGLYLGQTLLSSDTLGSHATTLAQWQGYLTPGADILLYGCNVAETSAGQALLGQLGQLTGADIAASSDLTGNAALGGDWELEFSTGSIESAIALNASTQANYTGLLAPGTSFNLTSFAAGAPLVTNGNASITGGRLQLTPNLTGQRGSAFYNQAIALDADVSFNTRFSFDLDGGSGGADGFTFVLQNTSAGVNMLGAGGGSLGYDASGARSLAIKFDTWQNGIDPNANHVALLRDGTQSSFLAVNANPGLDLNSGSVVNAWVDYNGANNNLQLFLSNGTTKPGTSVLSTTVDLVSVLGDRAFVGFTAATGGARNLHAITNWQFSSTDTTGGGPGTPPGTGTGLRGEYFDNIDFTAPVLTRTDATVNFDWGNGSPAANIGADTFSVRWTGQVEARFNETYTFYTTSDDGVKLWVNNQLIIDNFRDQAPTEVSGSISLLAGQKYDIRLEYYEKGGGAVSRLAWSSPSTAKQIIPTSQLYAAGGSGGDPTFNGNRYRLTDSLTWEEAQTAAQAVGGNLVTINTAAEETWLKQTFGGTEGFWIGITDRRVEGQFEWVNGEAVTYTNWAPGEPNNSGGNQDYGWMNFSATRQWDDNGATARLRGIIEIPSTPPRGTIALEQNTYSVNEAGGGVDIAVVRSGNTSGAATVLYRTDNGTGANGAIAGSDFTAQNGTLSFAAGESRKLIRIPILNDSVVEGNETFSFVVESPTGADLGTQRTAVVTILDDDNPALTVNDIRVSENAGNAVLTLTRGSGVGTASVQYTTANGTATAGSDYTSRTGTVTFAAGVTSQTISIPLINDTAGEANETFQVNFSNPVGLTLPDPSATVTITDDDAGSFVQETFVSGLTQPTAIAWTPDNSQLFVLEKSGLVKVIQNGVVVSTFADLRDQVNDVRDRGALGLAIHPNFYSGSPYIYVSYTYDPPEADRTGRTANTLDDADQFGNRPARVVRLTANTSNGYRTAVANSEFVLVGKNSTWANTSRPDGNSTTDLSIPESGRTAGGGYVQDYIKTDSESHTIGSLQFGADGALYISVGDGTSYNAVDPRTASVLTPDSLSGKILRVDPITGNGLSDNPFWDGNGNSNRSKVWNLGVRNPFRTTMKPGTSTLFIGDVGWKLWEEVNVGTRGANFGWGAYEGGTTTGVSTGTPTSLRQPEYDAANIPAIEAFYSSGQAVTAPIYARNHNEGARAIIMGDFYDGNTFPSIYNGALFISDVNEGTVDALTLDANNNVVAVRRFATGAQGVVQMVTGPDGNLYYVNLGTGVIGRWRPN